MQCPTSATGDQFPLGGRESGRDLFATVGNFCAQIRSVGRIAPRFQGRRRRAAGARPGGVQPASAGLRSVPGATTSSMASSVASSSSTSAAPSSASSCSSVRDADEGGRHGGVLHASTPARGGPAAARPRRRSCRGVRRRRTSPRCRRRSARRWSRPANRSASARRAGTCRSANRRRAGSRRARRSRGGRTPAGRRARCPGPGWSTAAARCGGGDVASVGRPARLDELAGRERRRAPRPDLAGPHEVGERVDRLLDRRVRVRAVDLVQVDVIGAQPPQAPFDGPADPPPRVAPLVRVRSHPTVELGGQHDVVPSSLQGLADDLLALAVRRRRRRCRRG